MQSEVHIGAEASCLKKHQINQNELDPTSTPYVSDIQGSRTNGAGPSVVEASCIPDQNEKGVLEQSDQPGSNSSSDSGDEKDEFPEGGLRGYVFDTFQALHSLQYVPAFIPFSVLLVRHF